MGFMRSLSYAWSGIVYAIRSEKHMRIHITAGSVVLTLAALLRLEAQDWAILVLAITLVIMAELVNTAVERVADLACGGEFHPLAKLAKDAASGAVLVCAGASVFIGLFVLGPPLWRLLAI